MLLDVSHFLIAATATQATVLSVFLLLPPHLKETSNRLLVVVLLSVAAEYVELFFYGSGVTIRHPNFAYFGTLLSILQPPAIYLYTRSLMYNDFELKREHAWHLAPFAGAAVVFLFAYYLRPGEVKSRILLEQDLPGMPTSLPLALIIHGIFLLYLVGSVRALQRFADSVRSIFSDVQSKQMVWLKVLLSGYAVIWLASLAYCLAFYIFKLTAEMAYVLTAAGISGFLFINVLVIYALKQSAVFSGLTAREVEMVEQANPTVELDQPSMEQKNQVASFMANEQPFLNANLSLDQLARQIGIAPRDLSFVINRGFGKNFFDFVGDYRIRHASALLDRKEAKKTILEVMVESGFNSKSVFNTLFKQKTGMTPTQFRNRVA